MKRNEITLSEREVRVSKGLSYRESTVYIYCNYLFLNVVVNLFSFGRITLIFMTK